MSARFTHKATGGEPIDEINIGDDMADVEISGNGDDEDELFDYIEVPEDVSESKLKYTRTKNASPRMTNSSWMALMTSTPLMKPPPPPEKKKMMMMMMERAKGTIPSTTTTSLVISASVSSLLSMPPPQPPFSAQLCAHRPTMLRPSS